LKYIFWIWKHHFKLSDYPLMELARVYTSHFVVFLPAGFTYNLD